MQNYLTLYAKQSYIIMIKICIAGKNNIAVNSLQFILKNYFEADQIVVIPNKNDKGIDSWQKSL
ncbi:TPA: hypothetical protein ACH6IQ_001714, partial [Campylobacter jejuni]